MIAKDHIKQLQADPDELDFTSLRRAGVDFLQALSSTKWTDYNLHDPGVTLLELLCYGITDLVYRTDFDVADYLADQTGRIDYPQQALFPPQDIFPNSPVTNNDYCKLIYDHISEVDDVWIESHNKSFHDDAVHPEETHQTGETSNHKTLLHPAGLFSVHIQLHESLFQTSTKSKTQIRQEIISLLARHRNLCRDLHAVHIIDTQAHHLSGEIEIDDSRPPAEVFADIYFRCAKFVSAGNRIIRFEEALTDGLSWESLLEGTLTRRGYIDAENFTKTLDQIDVIKLIALIRNIPGVKRVKRLRFANDTENGIEHLHTQDHGKTRPILVFPSDVSKMQALKLVYAQTNTMDLAPNTIPDHQKSDTFASQASNATIKRQATALWEQVVLYLKKYEFEHSAFRANQGNLNRLLQLPNGEFKSLHEYISIGENTPAIYGINHYGVPNSEPAEVHARARQLKAYLYPFEQLMGNYLASLQGIRQLYSLDANLGKTYFTQFFTEREIPGISNLYEDMASADQVGDIQLGLDNFADRRNRVLDSLLAIYGESFPSDALRRYYVDHPSTFDRFLIKCKIHYLKHLCELSTYRATGMNAGEPYGDGGNYATVQHKIQLLMGGNEKNVGRSLTAHLNTGKPVFVSDSRYFEFIKKQDNCPQNIPFSDSSPITDIGGVSAAGNVSLPHNWICISLLKAGIYLMNYRLHHAKNGQFWLCLHLVEEENLLPIIAVEKNKAAAVARHMHAMIHALNGRCEGFHLLEHILLRPRSKENARKIGGNFYAHQVSIILPAFTARFSDLGCRAWIEELISQNLPAHVMPDFYWLDYAFLAQFEQRHQHWATLLNDHHTKDLNSPADELDEAANQLIELLKKTKPQQSQQTWL